MAVLSPVAKQQFFDAGVPAAGYKLYTYAANSTTPQTTYSNASGTENTNPIVLDTQGRASIFLDPDLVYDYVLQTQAGVTVWTQEDVAAPTTKSAVDEQVALAEQAVTDAQAAQTAAALSAAAAAGHRVRALQLRGIPSGFDFDPELAIYMGASGFVVPAFNIDAFALTESNVYYVDPVSGNDTTGTGTSSAPYQSLKKAIHGKGDVTVWAKPGLYDRTLGWKTATATGRVTVRRWGDSGQIISSAHHAGLSWSLSTGSTYQATIVTAGSVADFTNTDDFGFAKRLTLRTSIANVDANPGSYYVNGTTVYVRTFDSRSPDSSLRVYAAEANGDYRLDTGYLWMEHCHFHGGTPPLSVASLTSGTSQRIYLKDCAALYSAENYDGLKNLGGGIAYMVRPIVAQNGRDGINHGKSPSGPARSTLEIDATCVNNGYSGTGIDNGSTAHDGCRTIRVGGYYYGNEGRNVQDVVGCLTWCLGSYASTSRGSGSSNGNFASGTDTDTSKMWLDTCTSAGSTNDTDASAGSTIYKRDFSGAGTAAGSGTTTTY
jgi:hypothetical protein